MSLNNKWVLYEKGLYHLVRVGVNNITTIACRLPLTRYSTVYSETPPRNVCKKCLAIDKIRGNK